MKTFLQVLIILVFTIQIVKGQDNCSYCSKIVTKIDFTSKTNDTITSIFNYDSRGELITKQSSLIEFASKIDTSQISGTEKLIVYSWKNDHKTYRYESIAEFELKTIRISISFQDTIGLSKFKMGRDGFAIDSLNIESRDTTIFLNPAKLGYSEMQLILSNVYQDSEFIPREGIYEFLSKKKLTLTSSKDSRNKVSVKLNKHSKPKYVKIYEWHNFHEFLFSNRYYYKYRSNRLVELKNKDYYGDLEMIKKIEYVSIKK